MGTQHLEAGPEAGAADSQSSQSGKRPRTREVRRQTTMAGSEVEEETERLRHFGSQREVVARRGREVKRRVGQQLDTARPLRRSLPSACGDEDLEPSMNLRRLDLGCAEEDVGRTVQGSASTSSASALACLVLSTVFRLCLVWSNYEISLVAQRTARV